MDEVRPRQKRIKADALNDAIQGGRLATGTRVRGGRQSQTPGTGQIIDARKTDKRKRVAIGTVLPVIVRKSPSPTAGWVRVQGVRYSDWPVQPCTDSGCHIGIAGPEFDVRPYYGKKDSSYTQFEVVGDTLDVSKTFFDIKWDGRQWIIEPPPSAGSAISLCLVHASILGQTTVPGRDAGATSWGSAQSIRVVHVKPSGSDYVTSESTAPGALGYSTVTTYPGTLANYWQYFQSTQGTAPGYTHRSDAVYFETHMIGGVEYITPVVPIASLGPIPNYAAGDCTA